MLFCEDWSKKAVFHVSQMRDMSSDQLAREVYSRWVCRWNKAKGITIETLESEEEEEEEKGHKREEEEVSVMKATAKANVSHQAVSKPNSSLDAYWQKNHEDQWTAKMETTAFTANQTI